MYSIAQLKVGTAIQIDGHPYVVTSSSFSKQARGSGVMKTTMKSLLTGNTLPMTFQGNDKIEPAEVRFTRAQFLYHQGEEYFFMDSETYEQFSFTKNDLGDQAKFLVDGSDVDIQNFDGNPINVQLPPKVNLKVIETAPAVRGDTAQGKVTKPATVETGATISVPIFVKEDDVIRINTETGEYCERVK
jgi:elongation factor P